MLVNEIAKLTRDTIAELVRSREAPEGAFAGPERRRSPRWPFPSTVELRTAGTEADKLWFGSCRDVSLGGVGMTGDHYFEPGTTLEIAIHLPEATLCGKATVRYCAQVEADDQDRYVTGLQFVFDE